MNRAVIGAVFCRAASLSVLTISGKFWWSVVWWVAMGVSDKESWILCYLIATTLLIWSVDTFKKTCWERYETCRHAWIYTPFQEQDRYCAQCGKKD